MKYGFFDRENNEYVINTPKLPSPWMNYLGNGNFGGLISATGGGLTFDGDPSNRRIIRYKFNNLPIDRPGRYIYIRDEETGDYFTPTWQPVQREMDKYECRHGFGYTKITGEYMGISANTTYFVPLNKQYEVWKTKLTNQTDKPRKLKIYSYVEFCWPIAELDTLCYWTAIALKSKYKNGKIIIETGLEQPTGKALFSYISTNLDVCGFDTDPAEFTGLYNDESKPSVLKDGVCKNSISVSDTCIGVLCSEITLAPNETKEFMHTLGAVEDEKTIDSQIEDAYTFADKFLSDIHKYWENVLKFQQVETPCDDMNLMLNSWHIYQAKTTFDWSRFISVYERGVDRGFGFRDSMQDVLGIMHAVPESAKERIKLLLSIQNSAGDTMSVYYPSTKKAEGGGRSDDHLWSILSVCNYVRETGDKDFLFENVAYYDGGIATVLEHLEQGIKFTMCHLGKHGIPDLLLSDWDDSLSWINKKGGAESVFVFFQLAHAAKELLELYDFYGLDDRKPYIKSVYDYCKGKADVVWDGEWFIRAFTPNGEKFGTKDDETNRVHLTPQAWSVLSGIATNEQANSAMDNVMKYLYTDKGIITHSNASEGYNPDKKTYYLFPAGAKENGGIFFHANTWAIIALTQLGRNKDAFACYEASLPCRRNDIADKCLAEPYVYCQNMMAPPHSKALKCVNSWLTGTASWMYYAATQYILGVRPEYQGLKIEPCIPSSWDTYKVIRICRGVECNINIKNGGKHLTVNGKQLDSNIVPWEMFENTEKLVINLTD